MIRVFLRKELMEIRRDKRLLVSIIILPFILLPIIGLILFATLGAQQPVIEIINQNPKNIPYVNFVEKNIESSGATVVMNSSSGTTPNAIIVFPKDFYDNVTNISRQAYVVLYVVISSNQQAVNIVNNALYNLLVNISSQRIAQLEKLANTSVSVDDIRNPIYLVLGYKTSSGSTTTSSANQLAQLSRLVALILFPSVTPVVFYLLEGITGERERRTLEALLSTPLTVRSFIVSKLLTASLLGFLSSIGDVLGTIIFVSVSGIGLAINLTEMIQLLALIVITYLISILLTGSLSLALLYIFGGSIRNIQIINFLILSFGMASSFISLFINTAQLSFPLSLIYIIPYVQLSLGFLSYVFGSIQESIFSLLVTTIISVVLIILVIRSFDSERLLLK
ncbi:ABC transporter permease [Sulfolobus acidocaldarius]|uniref:Conserved Archaeal protein n=4 Tax=Sulfolobus acidocaldarius TaxID=2285 RepID=Q4JA73_SULAC|nr:ABC transporter permease [Sulfolobus acidocaldarius]AAY80307.1 conserved Archaeal protein [Sulfolobus acidocaldarius DSM 639]AGE70888.1 ABC-2 type transport system permease protein [Sulfolobus acidocaldarius N8]AGE73159.1 ABC-2 type transport system permease protein [Sulfolobus acidocaldarius Ron12/I]ALU28804.1 sodium ABC transporter permease [Sulfolobus acidocaldarius]ALU31524.1 sodium ABC transporter permease [Sulfolobus acidocaldarius]